MNNKFTVVIPMYNSENTIKDCIESVLNQTRNDLISEIIVVNDGSTDNFLKQIEKIKDTKIKITIKNQINRGVSAARNLGLQHVETEWVALLDSDDRWVKDKIEVQNSVITENENIDFLGGNLTDENFKIFGKELPYLYKARVRDICIKNFPQPSTVVFKHKIFDEIGGFDVNQNYAEDGNYFLKICSKYNFYHIQEKLVDYGDGKRGFGDSGLSANLDGMYLGNKKNINELHKNKNISLPFYLFLLFFYKLKYFRRIMITRKVNSERNK